MSPCSNARHHLLFGVPETSGFGYRRGSATDCNIRAEPVTEVLCLGPKFLQQSWLSFVVLCYLVKLSSLDYVHVSCASTDLSIVFVSRKLSSPV